MKYLPMPLISQVTSQELEHEGSNFKYIESMVAQFDHRHEIFVKKY